MNASKPEVATRLDLMFNVTVPTSVDVAYTCVEALCAVVSIAGNSAVIVAFARCRCLRTVTNYYVMSLAVADLLVGLVGIPSAIATSVGLPGNFRLCILMNSILLLLCTGSILSLVAVTVDRFWAIVYPLTYSTDMTHRRAIWVISVGWFAAAFIGLLPSMGWNRGEPPRPRCFFMEVIDLRYLVFIYFLTIVAPTVFMAVVYGVIYRVVRHHIHQLSLLTPSQQRPVKPSTSPLKRSVETKAAKSIALIVFLFVVSWLPLYTINTVLFFCPDCSVPAHVLEAAIVLSHFNSAFNPALYAWAMTDFREAFLAMLRASPPWRRSLNDTGGRDRRETTTGQGTCSSRLTTDHAGSQTAMLGMDCVRSSRTTLSNSLNRIDLVNCERTQLTFSNRNSGQLESLT